MFSTTKVLVTILATGLTIKAATELPEVYTKFVETDSNISLAQRAVQTALAVEDDADPVEEEEVAPLVCEPTPEELLSDISAERELIANSREEAKAEIAEVDLAREKLKIEMSQLEELKGSVEALLGKVEASHTSDVDRLVAIYNGMKPAEASAIMNDLDIEVTVMVLGQMQERNVAPILAKMNPVRARAISKIIFERSKLPGDQKLNGIRLK